MTALAGAEPVAGTQHPAVQCLRFFLSVSGWTLSWSMPVRPELLLADLATAPHDSRMLVIDDSGPQGRREVLAAWVISGWAGTARWDNGVVAVTTLWADERLYCSRARGALYPGSALREGKGRSGVPHQAGDRRGSRDLGQGCGFRYYRAVAADSGSGDHDGFRGELAAARLSFVMGPETPPRTWAYKA